MNKSVGATSVSETVEVRDDAGLAVTGLNASNFPVVFWRSGRGAPNNLTNPVHNLSSVLADWEDAGLKEIGQGEYRLDLSNELFAVANDVKVWADEPGKHMMPLLFEVGLSNAAIPAAVISAMAGIGSVAINRAVVGGTITLWVDADYTIAHDRSVDVTVPAGTFTDLSLADAVYLGVRTTKDNTLGFTIEASEVNGSATLAQTIKFEPNHTDHTTVAKLDPAYAYVGEVLAVYNGTPPDDDVYEPVMKLKVIIEANRVTVPTP